MKDKWKQIFMILLIVLSFFGVSYVGKEKKETKTVMNKKEIEEHKYFLTDIELKDSEEKLTLLSILKKTPIDSVTLVIRDYLTDTENDSISHKDIINLISKKYNIPTHKVASIIFSYKYEMLTKEDIEDELQIE